MTVLSHKVCRGCGMNYSPDGGIGTLTWVFSRYCSRDCADMREPVKITPVLKKKRRSTSEFPEIRKYARNGEKMSPEYATWWGMVYRCENPKSPAYKDYGARGISVSERWHVFENFYADMGPWPGDGYTLERRNVNGNYEPNNCEWATWDVQRLNKRGTIRVKFQGTEKPLKEWCELLSIPYHVVRSRLRLKWPVELAFSAPKRAKRTRKQPNTAL